MTKFGMARSGTSKFGTAKFGTAKFGTGLMVLLFWTGLASGPAVATNDPDFAPTVAASVIKAEHQAIDLWLADVAACEAGQTSRCAPILY